MSEKSNIENGFSRNFIINSHCVRLLVSNDAPPKKNDPENLDFLVHIKCEFTDICDEIWQLLDTAAQKMKKEGEKTPEGESFSYKIRISTEKTLANTNVYVRDEKKDKLLFMSTAILLFKISDLIIEELENIDEKMNDKESSEEKENSDLEFNYSKEDQEENNSQLDFINTDTTNNDNDLS